MIHDNELISNKETHRKTNESPMVQYIHELYKNNINRCTLSSLNLFIFSFTFLKVAR
jgi:hypothetical protein